MSKKYTFTSESVGEGHPDKVCDRVSDAILDAYLKRDKFARVAVECLATTDYLCIAGEVRSADNLSHKEIENVARQTIKSIGYTQKEFHWDKIKIDVRLHEQSPDIAQGVDASETKEEGAGDQGIMFGYACKETDVLMPAPMHYSHRILENLAKARHQGDLSQLGPDCKAQVSLDYEDGVPVKANSIVVSTQHDEDLSTDEVRALVKPYIEKTIPAEWMCEEDKLYINPTGKFVIGGPHGDCGLTGRKIIVDTYGGAAPHGGGAFSGKDPTKVDRSAAYASRHAAKNIVAAGLADKCLIQISYAIGVSVPISIFVDTFGTSSYSDDDIIKALIKVADFRPRAIRERLELNKPIYERTATYGHFGRTPDLEGGFSWEKTDLVEGLLSAIKWS